MFCLVFFLLALGVSALIPIRDPSDLLPPVQWESDNLIKANYNDPTSGQTIPFRAPHYLVNSNNYIHDQRLAWRANDSSVVVVTSDSSVTFRRVQIEKFGYSSSLNQASFYGLNSAILIANKSYSVLENVNITTHNGAANLYAYGQGTLVEISDAWLYSSGPNAHGLYAAGNGTIIASNIDHYSGGNRCSAFAGDYPASNFTITKAVSRTDGIGSAIAFVVGYGKLDSVVGYAANAPALFHLSGHAIAKNSDLTASLLGGVVFFGIEKSESLSLTLEDTKLAVRHKEAPALWFGNTIGQATVVRSQLITESGILVVANYSTITQEFNFYAGASESTTLNTADARITIDDSVVKGDIVAYNGSTIGFSLVNNAYWTGKTRTDGRSAQLGVSLDSSSTWDMTGNVELYNFTNSDLKFKNIASNGFTISYDPDAPGSKALKKKTYWLPGGGKVKPMR